MHKQHISSEIKQCDNVDLLQSQSDESIDLIYCDVLYGTGRIFDDYKDIDRDKKTVYDFYQIRLQEMFRVLKQTGTIVIQTSCFIDHYLRVILEDIGFLQRSIIIWPYGIGLKARTKNYTTSNDVILVYSKSNNYTFNEQLVDCEKPEMRAKFQRTEQGKVEYVKETYYVDTKRTGTVWNDIKFTRKIQYSTQKPEKLLDRIIKSYSNENDIVADYFLGSGTTAVVCKKLNRNFIGCDVNAKSIDITQKRLKEIDSAALW